MAWSERVRQTGGYVVLSVTPVDMRATEEETQRRGAKVVVNGDLFRAGCSRKLHLYGITGEMIRAQHFSASRNREHARYEGRSSFRSLELGDRRGGKGWPCRLVQSVSRL
jgi:hypothetical protein